MRPLLMVLTSISLWVSFAAVSKSQPAPPAACPATTQVESTAIARAWHDDVINRRNPVMLRDIVGPEVVHHAAGGYSKVLNAIGCGGIVEVWSEVDAEGRRRQLTVPLTTPGR